MKKFILGSLLGLVVGVGAAFWSTHSRTTSETPPPKTESAADGNKENPLHFDREKRERAGILLVPAKEMAVEAVVPAYGRVLDPTPLIQLLAELDSARAASLVSGKEKERAEKLLQVGGNASEQNVETAQANAARDQAAVSSAEVRLMASWGRAVSERAADLQKAIAEGGSLVKLDVQANDLAAFKTSGVKLGLAGQTETFSAEVIGPATVNDFQTVGIGVVFLVRDRALPIGSALRGTLLASGVEPSRLPAVPRSAIVYHQGSAWLFVLGEEDTFERKLVTLGPELSDDQVAIREGVSAGDQVVASGAQQVLAAELQASWAGGEAD